VDVATPKGSGIFSRVTVHFSLSKSPARAAGDSAIAEGIT